MTAKRYRCADCGHVTGSHTGVYRACQTPGCSCAGYQCANCRRTGYDQRTFIDERDNVNCAVCGTTLRVIDG